MQLAAAAGPRRRVSQAPVTRSVLSDATYTAIRDLLLEHDIPPGQRVNIDALSARLGVSPTPVREALARLESDGLVVKTPLRGYSTTTLLTAKEFIELSQFRVVIEQWTAEQAALVPVDSPSELVDELAAINAAVAREPSGPVAMRALLEHDARFHGMIATLAGNELFAQSLDRAHFHLHFLRLYLAARGTGGQGDDLVSTDSSRSVAREWEQQDQITHTLAQHAAITDAIGRRDGMTAARLMREHIEESRRRTLPMVRVLLKE